MLTHLQTFFGVQPRHAEQSDTRQEIRRHDPDAQPRKKDDDRKSDEDFAMADDHAVVSVPALRVFLENFLKTQKAQGDADEQVVITQPRQAKDSGKVLDGETVRAVRAYQHTALAGDEPAYTGQASQNSQELLGGEDVRTIHILMADLEELSARGVEYLKIEKASTFLGSLVAAVAAAKEGFS